MAEAEMREWLTYLKCAKCGREDVRSFKTQKERREHNLKIDFGNWYCHTCDPKLLHGEEKERFAIGLIGLRYFDLHYFRRSLLPYDAKIETIVKVEIDKTVVYSADGTIEKVGLARPYSNKGTWQSLESFQNMPDITDAHRQEIINICDQGIESAWGWTRDQQISGFERIKREIVEFEGKVTE